MAIRVLIVDDSAVVRQVLTEQLSSIAGIEVMGTARDPLFARQLMAREWPDVIVLDIEMPRMDGLTFLRQLMAEHPTPVVICSTLAERGSAIALQALSAGAVDIIPKPKIGLRQFLEESRTLLGDAIKAAAQARLDRAPSRSAPPLSTLAPQPSVDAVLGDRLSTPLAGTTDRVVAIGTSTGGTQALEYILTRLPRTAPGIVIVQHMPAQFTAAFAARLNQLCEIEVREAKDGDRVLPGLALIAPGSDHLLLRRSGAQYRVEVRGGPLVSRHCPSVDVLFRSTAQAAGPNAIGIIMTGMGDDGARGLLEMHQAGALTIAQDEQSCVVYGMPKEAVKLGAVDAVLGLDQIPALIVRTPSRLEYRRTQGLPA
ncbi:chemotaxis response regulator protein-glutamate methylesterase [Caldichromatium japonicum]|uniref:Protein-glutamate methylesterase/protein-glutamine glutaminase n=1 Tax=Caldichromatium japonicum TaxID=2699430 RepID=A0A6G7VGI5_9GAMM|nr:chemotaxis response regulator protein-glutamate methylesterase [Caldichromatium japonicum]QIK39062.1 chemotaxis response regulator protein-glutamate methylesterase [Caldichromatium japonicum]